jgi:hypothetical protein
VCRRIDGAVSGKGRRCGEGRAPGRRRRTAWSGEDGRVGRWKLDLTSGAHPSEGEKRVVEARPLGGLNWAATEEF